MNELPKLSKEFISTNIDFKAHEISLLTHAQNRPVWPLDKF